MLSFFGEPPVDLADEARGRGLELIDRDAITRCMGGPSSDGARCSSCSPGSLVLFAVLAAGTSEDSTLFELGRDGAILRHLLHKVEGDVAHLIVEMKEGSFLGSVNPSSTKPCDINPRLDCSESLQAVSLPTGLTLNTCIKDNTT